MSICDPPCGLPQATETTTIVVSIEAASVSPQACEGVDREIRVA